MVGALLLSAAGLGALAIGVQPAQAAGPTLTLTPAQGAKGSTFTATYAWNQQCPNDFVIRIFWDSFQQPIGSKTATEANCSATVVVKVPTTATCTKHTVYGRVENGDAPFTESTASAAFTVVCPQPTLTPTPKPTPKPTPSARKTSPPPTRSVAPTTTAAPSRTPTPTSSAAPSRSPSAAPVVAPSATIATVPPPAGGSSDGTSRLPWAVGGGMLAVVGVAAALGLLAPRGAPKLIVGGVVAASLAGGAALAVAPDAIKPDPSLVGATYTTLSTSDSRVPPQSCRDGDMPLNGGFEAFDVRPNIRYFHPMSRGAWETEIPGYTLYDEDGLPSGAGPGGNRATVCLSLRAELGWQVRELDRVDPASRSGYVDCQSGETAVSGGWYLYHGRSGIVGSFPETEERWALRLGGRENRTSDGTVYALCVRFPSNVEVYHATASASGGTAAIARCKPGDGVLNGGGYAYPIAGNHPVDGGWAVEAQRGGTASAFAICYDAGRAFGLHASYTRSATGTGLVTATCERGDSILAGGWTNGHGFDTLKHFTPDGAGWRVQVSPSVGGAASSYALCAKPYAP